ncbi:MAG: ROK family protein [Sulfurovum sp.]|nr:ROK family protein [Sulfurovaceae bacterium]
MKSKLFIDIGGTHLRSELEIDNKIIKDNISSQDIDLIEFIEAKLTIYPKISFVGISFAGQVNNGHIISSPNIKVSNHNIKSFFENNYNIKLEIDNDLNCAIRAESNYFKSKFITAIYIGTGLGCAVIDNGKIVTGAYNQSFELGHIPYKKSPFICGCGKSNCIELFVSGLAIERWSDYKNISYDNINLENKEIKEIFQDALLQAIATAITLSNSQILVLGGGVIKKNPYLIDWIKKEIKNQVMPNILKDIKIVNSRLKNGAMKGSRLLH